MTLGRMITRSKIFQFTGLQGDDNWMKFTVNLLLNVSASTEESLLRPKINWTSHEARTVLLTEVDVHGGHIR